MALAGRQWMPPAASVTAGAAQIARQEQLRVSGDLYWVSAPMTDLARHAAPRLPTRNLHAHDLPSRTGFMVFEAPLATYLNSEGREVQIAAVSWGPWDGPASQWDHGGIWLSFFSHPAPLFPRQAFTGGTADPAFLAPLMGTVPPVLPDNEAGWPFGELPRRPADPRRHHRAMGARHPCRVAADAPAPRPGNRPAQRTAPPAVGSPARACPLPTSGSSTSAPRPARPARPTGSAGARASTASSGGSAATGAPTGADPAAAAPRTAGSIPISPARTISQSTAPSA